MIKKLKCLTFASLLIGVIQQCRGAAERYTQKYRMSTSARLLPERLLTLMDVYQQEASLRIHETLEMRFMYEESAHYEQGYLIAEILEKYRKMVGNVRRPVQFFSDTIFAILKKTEIIQKLYFEIYHLCHMAHEIYRKFQHATEFLYIGNPTEVAKVFLEKEEKRIQEKIEKHEVKKKEKIKKKLDTFLQEFNHKEKRLEKKPYNKWWPLDYGWEIDHEW